MIGVALIVVVGVLLLGLGVLVTARRASADYDALRRRLGRPGPGHLVFDVPEGVDPVSVVIALRRAGLQAAEDGALHRVLVFCPDGRAAARDRIRAVIAEAEPRDVDPG
ncbi:MAG: hypothetical protein QM747_16945 [Nocardioides sp.]